MNKFFDFDQLYAFNKEWQPEYDGLVLTIDNFYANPNQILEHLQHRQYPMWKYNPERNSRNGVDYFDCRITDLIAFPTRKYFADMDRVLFECRKHWWKGEYQWDNMYEFNIFQTHTIFDNTLQHYPHIDTPLECPNELSTLNMIVYLDKQENGGTAVYGGEWITNDEQINLLYPVESRFKLERKIPAKFNRCVIFPGNRIHGAYIDDYTKYCDENWRISQVRFLRPNDSK